MPRIVNIQLLRAIAALAIVFYHTAGHYYAIGGQTHGNLFSFFGKYGFAGVDVFFVISGYIIWITTRETNGLKDIVAFIYSRLTRIYLGYWPFFIILLLLAYLLAPAILNKANLFESFFLTYHSTSKSLLKITWTLQYELYFYFSFALFLLLPKKWSLKILLLFVFIIVASQAYAILHLDIYAKKNFNSASSLYTFCLSPFFLEFIAGCFIGIYFERHRISSIRALLSIFVVLVLMVYFYQEFYIAGSLAQGYYRPERIFFYGSISALMLAVLLEMEKRSIQILPKFSLLFGGASYALFLAHPIFLFAFYQTGIRNRIKDYGNHQLFFITILIIIIMLYSILHYKIVELPLTTLSKKLKALLERHVSNRLISRFKVSG